VAKPVYETRERDVCRTVCKPVHFTKTVKVCGGRWETETYEVPGPVVTRCIREPGCWVCNPCTGRRSYVPGKVCKVEEQCPPRTVTKKTWVPTVWEKQVNCVRYENETIVEKQSYKVCKMVAEQSAPAATRSAGWCRRSRFAPAPTGSATWWPSSG
jgi:hypothetical protein